MFRFLLLLVMSLSCLYSPPASAACPLGGCWDGNVDPYPICVCDADGLCAEICGLKGDDYAFNTDSCTCDYVGSCPGDGCYDPYTCDCDPSGQCYIECYQRGAGWGWLEGKVMCGVQSSNF